MKIRSVPRFRPYLSPGVLKQALRVWVNEEIAKGKWTRRFEREFSEYIGRRHAIAVPSGRMALSLILSALGFGKGDEVILPAYTVPEVIMILRCAGVTPRFADADAITYNIVRETIEPLITKATRAILMTHLFGRPCDVEDILRIAETHQLVIIEDAAQACGATHGGKKIGSFGLAGYFSFGLVKNLNTLGGGMIVTDDDPLAEKIRLLLAEYPLPGHFSIVIQLLNCLLLWGITQPFFFAAVIYPIFRLLDQLNLMDRIDDAFDEKEISKAILPASYRRQFTNLQAAMGCAQLAMLDKMNQLRMNNAAKVLRVLSKNENFSPSQSRDICLNLLVCSSDRDRIIRRFRRYGVDTTKGYLRNCAGMAQFAEFGRHCPVAQTLSQQGFYLPVYSHLKPKELDLVIQATRAILIEGNES